MNKLKCSLFLVFIIFLLTSCSMQNQSYSYSNLTGEQEVEYLRKLLTTANVPPDDIDMLLSYVTVYNNGMYATQNLHDGWKTAATTKQLYNYNEAINSYEDSPFDDFNCRQTAYLIYHSFFDALSAENSTDEAVNQGIASVTGEENPKYTALISDLLPGNPVKDSVLSFWKKTGIEFSEQDIKLVSLWGEIEGMIKNLHCGVLIYDDSDIYFFEKTDPLMPYQLSKFDSTSDLNTYLLNRTEEANDMVVFINDKAL